MTDIPIPDGSEPRELLGGAERFDTNPINQYLVDIEISEASGSQDTASPFSDFVDQVLGKTTNRVGSLGWLFAGVEPKAERELPRFNLTEFPKMPINQEPIVLKLIRANDATEPSPLPRFIPIDEPRKKLPPSVLELLTELREKLQKYKFNPLKEIPDLMARFGVQKPTPVDEPAQHVVSIEPLPEVGLPKGADGLIDPIALDHGFVPPTDAEFAKRTYRWALKFLKDISPEMFNNRFYKNITPEKPLNPNTIDEYHFNPKLPEPKKYIEN